MKFRFGQFSYNLSNFGTIYIAKNDGSLNVETYSAVVICVCVPCMDRARKLSLVIPDALRELGTVSDNILCRGY